jgi:hypothetical protein
MFDCLVSGLNDPNPGWRDAKRLTINLLAKEVRRGGFSANAVATATGSCPRTIRKAVGRFTPDAQTSLNPLRKSRSDALPVTVTSAGEIVCVFCPT